MPPTLAAQRSTTLQHARAIVDRAKSANRELTAAEQAEVESDVATIHELDRKLRGVAAVKSVLELGNYDRDFDPDTDSSTRYLSFRNPRVKSDMTARFGSHLGLKALMEDGSPVVSVPLDAQPYRQSEPPTSLLEVIPAVIRPVTYRYMRQTTRNNAAAPVAPGALKPTSTYGLVSVEGRLRVVAHVSEPLAKYDLRDAPSLAQFVQDEMVAGVHAAVENQIIAGDGVGENLTGLANTSGIQTQAYTTSPILTARAAVTKVEVLGFQPSVFAVNPTTWEAIETTSLNSGAYVLNAEGSRSGVPVDSAARRLWGVPVTVSTAVPAGTGYLLSNGAVQLATDGQIDTEQSEATGDDFARNAVRLRVETRVDLAVLRPLGVVQLDLTAA